MMQDQHEPCTCPGQDQHEPCTCPGQNPRGMGFISVGQPAAFTLDWKLIVILALIAWTAYQHFTREPRPAPSRRRKAIRNA